MEKPEVHLSVHHKKQLVQEFKVVYQTVFYALKYHSDSNLAKRIRRRAKQLLVEESERIID